MLRCLTLLFLSLWITVFPASMPAEEGPLIELSTAISLSPEFQPYHSKIESSYRVLSILVEQPGPLQSNQRETLSKLRRLLDMIQTNITENKAGRTYLRHLVRPVEQVIKAVAKAEAELNAGKGNQAKQSLQQAFRLVRVCYSQPVCQMIVAEQEVASGADLMAKKDYEDAVKVLDVAIDRLSQIKVQSSSPYANDLAKVKSQVLALRRKARKKTVMTPGQKFIHDLAHSFNSAHESAFDLWGGPADMKHLR